MTRAPWRETMPRFKWMPPWLVWVIPPIISGAVGGFLFWLFFVKWG